MNSTESTTIPTTVEDLEKLVRGIVADVFKSTANFCTAVDEAPSTGDGFLDKALDDLDPVAKTAVVALLSLHGRDDRVDGARARLKAHVSKFSHPDILRELCADADNAEAEEAVRFWLTLGSAAN